MSCLLPLCGTVLKIVGLNTRIWCTSIFCTFDIERKHKHMYHLMWPNTNCAFSLIKTVHFPLWFDIFRALLWSNSVFQVPEQNAGDSRERVRRFTFDYCFHPDATQSDVGISFLLPYILFKLTTHIVSCQMPY